MQNYTLSKPQRIIMVVMLVIFGLCALIQLGLAWNYWQRQVNLPNNIVSQTQPVFSNGTEVARGVVYSQLVEQPQGYAVWETNFGKVVTMANSKIRFEENGILLESGQVFVRNTSTITLKTNQDLSLPSGDYLINHNNASITVFAGNARIGEVQAGVNQILNLGSNPPQTLKLNRQQLTSGNLSEIYTILQTHKLLPVSLQDLIPPTIQNLTPVSGTAVTTATIEVAGLTESTAILTINNIPVAVSANGEFKTQLNLISGLNNIEVSITDANGNTANQRIVYQYNEPTTAPLL